MPPPMITKVIPTVTTPIADACCRIVKTLFCTQVASPYSSGRVTIPMITRTTSTPTSPRLRRTGSGVSVATSASRGPPAFGPAATVAAGSTGGDCAGSVPAWCSCMLGHAGSPSMRDPAMTRSRTVASSSLVGGGLVDQAALAHDQHPVGQAEHLGDLAGDQQHADAAGGEVVDDLVELGPGADVHAAGGLVEQQQLGAAEQPAADDDLLLVAAGQRAHRRGRRRGGRSSSESAVCVAAARSRPVSVKPTAGVAGEGGQRHVAVDRLVQQQRLALALLGRHAHAGPDGGADMPGRSACRSP